MQTTPSMTELVAAVKHFIDETAAPNLEGHANFHARIASNVLSIVLREIDQGANAKSDEIKRLQALLPDMPAQTGEHLNAALCKEIASGKLTPETAGLLTHLKTTAIAQLKIDQPHYSGLMTALETSK